MHSAPEEAQISVVTKTITSSECDSSEYLPKTCVSGSLQLNPVGAVAWR